MATPIFTRVLVPAASYDLTDLDTVKDELSLKPTDSTKDDFLARAISQVSKAAASYCNRVFAVETVKDTFTWQSLNRVNGFRFSTARGRDIIQLSRFPVVDLPITLTAPSETDTGLVLPFPDTSGLAVGQPVSHAGVPDGTCVADIATGASVTLSAPLTAPIKAGNALTFGVTIATFAATSDPTSRIVITPDQYEVDADCGQIHWPGADASLTTISYRAGFPTVPDDLIDAILRAVTGRNAARGRDPLMRSQDQPMIGNQSYWIGTSPGQRGGFTGEIADILDSYASR